MEKVEKLKKVMDEFANSNETLFVIYANGDNGQVGFTGNGWKLQDGFYKILKSAFAVNKSERDFDVASAMLGAMVKMLRQRTKTSIRFRNALLTILSDVLLKQDDQSKQIGA